MSSSVLRAIDRKTIVVVIAEGDGAKRAGRVLWVDRHRYAGQLVEVQRLGRKVLAAPVLQMVSVDGINYPHPHVAGEEENLPVLSAATIGLTICKVADPLPLQLSKEVVLSVTKTIFQTIRINLAPSTADQSMSTL